MKVSLDRYIISPTGKIYDKQKEMFVEPFNSGEYLECCIHDENGKHKLGVHIIVAMKYCESWFDGCIVHHKDGNKHNNNIENLECMSKADHAILHHKTIFDKIMICPNCKKEFIWTEKQQKRFQTNYHKQPFCSKKCGAQSNKGHKRITREIKCIETNTIYKSCAHASKEMNISKSLIYETVTGKHKSTHGFHFVYLT